jgi:RNA polymerase sigma factor (sigma-70 family)
VEAQCIAIFDSTLAPSRNGAEPACRVAGSEDDLVRRAASDPEAFSVLYRRHYRAVAGCLFRRTGNTHTAEDLAAETFMAAYRAIRRYRPSGTPLRFWLLRIATNTANRWARRRARAEYLARAKALFRSEVQPPVRADSAEGDRLHRALGRLPAAQQSVISLHYFEGLSVEEVAATLDCSAGTIKSRLSRGRAALRDLLGEEARP